MLLSVGGPPRITFGGVSQDFFGALCLGGRGTSLALRYIQVQEHYLPTVRHISCGTDGMRVSTKDIQYVCFAGRAPGSKLFRSAWDIKVSLDPLLSGSGQFLPQTRSYPYVNYANVLNIVKLG